MTSTKLDTFANPFERLLSIIAALRDPATGCPWDKEQTHLTLKKYMIEEAYEAIDAIDLYAASGSAEEFKMELGDVLLQVVLHSQIASETKAFDAHGVVTALCDKLISRHPHVFGDMVAQTSAEVLSVWEKSKQKKLKEDQGILDSIPRALPALLRAARIRDKVARVGFIWNSREGVVETLRGEVEEFCAEIKTGDKARLEDEFGDILFTLAQLARHMDMNPEEALSKANDKFTRRFKHMEQSTGKDFEQKSPEEKEALWVAAKKVVG